MPDQSLTNSWINSPIILEDDLVKLEPLESKHFDALRAIAADKRIWEFYPADYSDADHINDALTKALEEREKGSQYPFVIIDRRLDKVIGSTRFLDIQPAHRKLEIGWTWLHPDYWATNLNTACKLLLLQYCFETLKTVRVQLKTDENNLRSRKAIQKIGGQFEGILRHDMVRGNGTMRNSAYFSIIDKEWQEAKNRLQEKLK
ncbi:RimJ/RimL family protein N-acetyltransferase [Mucilaginibacter yixingensis]|uniref:RimJ/RimL family protein N-acetyltransferase n=1 Tax=Mucilaginibacter yixingensis TaxID=1295612 RepID=A0A2T5J649_9SPHI|nr:GNAT family N-acetyltransferase [Mucilaginibacter yixingensis]PTQ94018.1 RimJ/RimL family protein N-acetyltransferase [Mucilaginibacter yixingensis]